MTFFGTCNLIFAITAQNVLQRSLCQLHDVILTWWLGKSAAKAQFRCQSFHEQNLTVPIRRNLTENVLVNGNRTDTERVQERKLKGYRRGTEQIQNGYRTGMGTRVELKQNAFCQAFPVRFLICTVILQIKCMRSSASELVKNGY